MRTLLVLIIFFFSCMHAEAQRFNAFLNAGIVASQVSGDNLAGFNKAGFTGGVGVSAPVGKRMDVAFEITYVQKGSRKPSRLDQGDPTQYLMRLNYLEVPLTLSYKITDRISGYAGAAAAYLFGSYEANENGELTLSLPFQLTDISACGGVSYLLTDNLSVHVRGTQSVLPVRKFGGSTYGFIAGGQYNSVMELLLAFYLKKKHDEK
jgi:opacity protein-like surface antigen